MASIESAQTWSVADRIDLQGAVQAPISRLARERAYHARKKTEAMDAHIIIARPL
ncbi:hypothetical protein X566_22235 [Afipia sp. P52-10]|uniref:hypothetical protein n=1 Tax=Afipia sp. P52-10 TaxID=1429916 RepID=UPI0003DF3484|nr:hypothetical protein [Afipia sp. P52-10]ETR75953.1 hypothetical protein X566_22235 [Afipia sp. P52-10]